MATNLVKFVIRLEMLLDEAQPWSEVSVFVANFWDLQRASKVVEEVIVTNTTRSLDSLQTIEITAVDMHEKGNLSCKTELHKLGKGTVKLYRHRNPILGNPGSLEDTLGIMAIPAYLTSVDLLNYFGDSIRSIKCLRMIKAEQNCHIALLKFCKSQDAHVFRKKFDGVRYNEWSSDALHCISVSHVTINKAKHSGMATRDLHDGVSRVKQPHISSNVEISRLVQLPTCVSCLERMDAAVTGLSSSNIPNTLYHSCMRKTNPECSICCLIVAKSSSARQDRFCATCLSGKNIWMCLLCGQLSCGRYESKHAIEHFEGTKHAFAMDVDSGRIWSYESDSYVHRIISERNEDDNGRETTRSSLPLGAAEFEQLLATQLESQRIFFEGQLAKADSRVSKFLDRESGLRSDLEKAQGELEHSKTLLLLAQQATEDQSEITRKAEAKSRTLSSLARSLELQYKDEKSINHALMERLAFMESEAERLREDKNKTSIELEDAREQLNDLLLHLSSAKEIAQIPELHEATVGVKQRRSNRRKNGKNASATKDA